VAQKFTTNGGDRDHRGTAPWPRLQGARQLAAPHRHTASAASFPVAGVAPLRNQLSAGFGVSIAAGPDPSPYANYDAILPTTGNTTEQTIQAKLRWKF
jgi:uncharacterized protein with beta-barrel porin domain